MDVAFADPIHGEPDELAGSDLLGFAGMPPVRVRAYPVGTHIAEKLHAYTLPRDRPNSRIKDLPDLALLATVGVLQADRIRAALQQTFAFHCTHALSQALPEPPKAWAQPYVRMAEENALPWKTLPEVTSAAQSFLDPVLAGRSEATWSPERWAWQPT